MSRRSWNPLEGLKLSVMHNTWHHTTQRDIANHSVRQSIVLQRQSVPRVLEVPVKEILLCIGILELQKRVIFGQLQHVLGNPSAWSQEYEASLYLTKRAVPVHSKNNSMRGRHNMSAGAHTHDECTVLCRVLPCFAEHIIMCGIMTVALDWLDELHRECMHWQAGAWQLSRQSALPDMVCCT